MSRLDIHVGGTFADSKLRILAAVAGDQRGEAVAGDHVTFTTPEALARLMTSRRFEVLRHLHRNPERSISALARSLGRDDEHVRQDVEALSEVGLIERDDEGLRADCDALLEALAEAEEEAADIALYDARKAEGLATDSERSPDISAAMLRETLTRIAEALDIPPDWL